MECQQHLPSSLLNCEKNFTTGGGVWCVQFSKEAVCELFAQKAPGYILGIIRLICLDASKIY